MFYFYFQSRQNEAQDPLLIWLTGGPGCSSGLAVFEENGPYQLTKDGEVEEREYAWDVTSNVIFVDSPIGAGFSYSDDPRDRVFNESVLAADLLDFMEEFLEARPELKDRNFFVTGESYAGHYIPAFSHHVWRTNRRKPEGDRMRCDSKNLRRVAEQRLAEVQAEVEAAVAARQQPQRLPGPGGLSDLQGRLRQAIATIQEGLVERDTEARLLLLAALSGEHILFIGPPGTAKSELGRRLSQLYKGNFFERLLTRFSVPEELFGPLSMRALEEDQYVRQTDGYLPDAAVAFIDEIFKANSAILNTLLTILNERLFDNGSQRSRVPLLCLVGASNELPESEELDALYDRFLVRREVSQVSSANIVALLEAASAEPRPRGDAGSSSSSSSNGSGGSTVAGWQAGDAATSTSQAGASLLTAEDFENTRAEAVRAVRVPKSVIAMIADLRSHLQENLEPPVYVSDRRLVKAIAMLQVAAYTNGRTLVSEYDLLLLQHVLWQRPEEAQRVADYLLGQLASDSGGQIDMLLQGLFARACKALGQPAVCASIADDAANLRGVLIERLAEMSVSGSGDFPVLSQHLWLGGQEAESTAAALAPKLRKGRDGLQKLLFDVIALEVSLEQGLEPVVLSDVLQQRWAKFIREAPMGDVRPLGTRPARSAQSGWGPGGRSQPPGGPPDPEPQLNRDYGA